MTHYYETHKLKILIGEHLLEERPQSRSSNPEAEDDEHAIAAGAGDNQGMLISWIYVTFTEKY